MIVLDFIQFLQIYSEIYSNLLNNLFVKYPKLLKIIEIFCENLLHFSKLFLLLLNLTYFNKNTYKFMWIQLPLIFWRTYKFRPSGLNVYEDFISIRSIVLEIYRIKIEVMQ